MKEDFVQYFQAFLREFIPLPGKGNEIATCIDKIVKL